MDAQPEPATKPQKMTPADVVNHRQDLRPLPLRVAKKQYERLDAARTRTGLSIQEHARRALDLYLAVIEREAIELGLMPERFQPQAANPVPSHQPGAGAAPTTVPVATIGRSRPPRVRKR